MNEDFREHLLTVKNTREMTDYLAQQPEVSPR